MGVGYRGRPRAVTSVQKGAMKSAGFRLPQCWRSNLNILLHGMHLNFIKKSTVVECLPFFNEKVHSTPQSSRCILLFSYSVLYKFVLIQFDSSPSDLWLSFSFSFYPLPSCLAVLLFSILITSRVFTSKRCRSANIRDVRIIRRLSTIFPNMSRNANTVTRKKKPFVDGDSPKITEKKRCMLSLRTTLKW